MNPTLPKVESDNSDRAPTPLAPAHRNNVIDFLRGISILLVVMRHMQIRIPFEKTPLLQDLPKPIWSFLFKSGSEGVRIFFVISGFLITLHTLKRWGRLDRIEISRFYQMRFARIAPCLLALLGVLSVLHFLKVEHYTIQESVVSLGRALFSALTFHLNWIEGKYGYLPGNWDVLWSLSVEEMFYLFFPTICLFSRWRWLPYLILVAFVVLGPLSRIQYASNPIWQSKAYLAGMDSIALGCLTALFVCRREITNQTAKVYAVVGGLICVGMLLFKHEAELHRVSALGLSPTLLSCGVAFLLIASSRLQFRSLSYQILSPVIWFGRVSYEVYLTHMFVVFTATSLFPISSSNWVYVELLAVISVSAVIGHLIESRFSAPVNLWLRTGFPRASLLFARAQIDTSR